MFTELEKITLERKNKMLELMKTLSWEEARQVVDNMDFQHRIDLILDGGKKKKKKKLYNERINSFHQIFRIIGLFSDCRIPANGIIIADETEVLEGGKILKKWRGPTINSKAKYARCIIKRIGYEYFDDEGIYNAVLDNADEEDIEWFKDVLKNKGLEI